MNRLVAQVLGLLIVATLALVPGGSAGEAQLQEATAFIEPAVLEALETEVEVEVIVGLKQT